MVDSCTALRELASALSDDSENQQQGLLGYFLGRAPGDLHRVERRSFKSDDTPRALHYAPAAQQILGTVQFVARVSLDEPA